MDKPAGTQSVTFEQLSYSNMLTLALLELLSEKGALMQPGKYWSRSRSSRGRRG